MKIILSVSGISLACILALAIVPNLLIMQTVNAQLSPSSSSTSPTSTTSLSPSSLTSGVAPSTGTSPTSTTSLSPSTSSKFTSPSSTTSPATLTPQCIGAQTTYKNAKIALDSAIKSFSAAPWDPILKSKYLQAINNFNSAALALGFIPNCPKPVI